MGGGFGLEGAIQGIVIAEVLNALTTTVDTVTILHISGAGGGVALHTAEYEPDTLRIRLSAGFASVAKARKAPTVAAQNDPFTQLERLGDLKTKGLLTDTEYEQARAKIVRQLTGEE